MASKFQILGFHWSMRKLNVSGSGIASTHCGYLPAAPVQDERQRGTVKIAGPIKRRPEMGWLLFIKTCDVTTNLCFRF